MYRYIQWDYDKKEAIEYERIGDCNQCGQCCRAIIEFIVNSSVPEEPCNGGDGTNGQGKWNEVQNDKGERRFFRIKKINTGAGFAGHACSDLRVDGQKHYCAIYNTRPLLHRAWPLAPEQVTPFPECSYSFREVIRWKFDT